MPSRLIQGRFGRGIFPGIESGPLSHYVHLTSESQMFCSPDSQGPDSLSSRRNQRMSKVDEDAPLEDNYEALSAALDEALTKASLAAEQLRVAKLTLEASESSLAEIETSEEARTECDVNFTVAHLV